jgi:hypothetical protein
MAMSYSYSFWQQQPVERRRKLPGAMKRLDQNLLVAAAAAVAVPTTIPVAIQPERKLKWGSLWMMMMMMMMWQLE